MAEILKAKPVVDAMKEELTKKVEALKAKNIAPTVAICRVAQGPASL